MGKYIIKRLLYFIPTFFLLLILTFFLLQSTPGDAVEEMMSEDEFTSQLNTDSYEERYNYYAAQKGYGNPMFYFSLLPANKKKLKFESSALKRKIYSEWLSRFNAQEVYRYFNLIQSLIDQESNVDINNGLVVALPLEAGQLIDQVGFNEPDQSNLRTAYLAALNSKISLSNSLPVFQWNGVKNRFHRWFIKALVFDWGTSITDGSPVQAKVFAALKWTLMLSMSSFLLSVAIGLSLGLSTVPRIGHWSEQVISALAYILFAIPLFWLATLFIVFFTTSDYGSWTNIFPSAGIIRTSGDAGFLVQVFSQFKYLLLPILCMVLSGSAYLYRQMQSNGLDEAVKKYVTALRSRGVPFTTILRKHISRNAIYPFIGLLATIIPGLISGSLVIEVLFNIPGMGRLLLDAVGPKDWNVVGGIVIVTALFTFVGFLITDIALYLLNPKIKYGQEG